MFVYELTYHDTETCENDFLCESLEPGDLRQAYRNDQRRNGHRLQGLYDVMIFQLLESDEELIPHNYMDWPQFRAAYLNDNDK